MPPWCQLPITQFATRRKIMTDFHRQYYLWKDTMRYPAISKAYLRRECVRDHKSHTLLSIETVNHKRVPTYSVAIHNDISYLSLKWRLNIYIGRILSIICLNGFPLLDESISIPASWRASFSHLSTTVSDPYHESEGWKMRVMPMMNSEERWL